MLSDPRHCSARFDCCAPAISAPLQDAKHSATVDEGCNSYGVDRLGDRGRKKAPGLAALSRNELALDGVADRGGESVLEGMARIDLT